MEETNHIPDEIFPFTKTSGVGANHEPLNWERHGEIV